MRRVHALMVVILMMVGVLVGVAPAFSAAGPATLTGIVTRSGGNVVDQASVKILTPGTTDVVVATSTNTDGRYSLVVEEGTYDVLFTGPVGSGFGSARINGQSIAGTTEVDVILSVQSVQVTGSVTASTGEPLSNASLSFMGPNANTSATVDPTTGTYTANLPTGTYTVMFNHMNMGNSNVPGFNLTANDFTVTGNTTLDLTLPITPITVHIRDANGNPVTASISVDMPMPGQPAPDVHPTLNFRHNSFGNHRSGTDVTIPATTGNLRITAHPTIGTATSINVTATANGPNDFTITLPTTVQVTGTVTPSTGGNLSMANIAFNGPNANANVNIDPTTGTYTANLPVGTYNVMMYHMNMGNSDVPAFNLAANDFVVTGNTTLDLTLPITPLTVHIRDANGNPVTANVTVSMPMPGAPAPGIHPTLNFRHNSFSGYKFGSDVVVPATPGNLRLSVTPSNGPFPTGTTITADLVLTGDPKELTVLLSGDVVDGNPDTSNDGDNVSDVVEGLGPNNGDGNLDGVADADQINVTSLPVFGATTGNDYVTIATPAGTTLTDVYTLDPTNPAQVTVPPPANVTLPEGLTRFIVEGLTPGASTTISIYTASTAGITGYAKYNETTHVWTTLPAANVAITPGRINLTLTDGGVGDDDGVANGRIVDPGGPAIITGQPPVITIKGITDGATYVLGKVPSPSCKAKDALTGKKVTCRGVVSGGQSNGIGDFTYTATAMSTAGATATTVVRYRVIY